MFRNFGTFLSGLVTFNWLVISRVLWDICYFSLKSLPLGSSSDFFYYTRLRIDLKLLRVSIVFFDIASSKESFLYFSKLRYSLGLSLGFFGSWWEEMGIWFWLNNTEEGEWSKLLLLLYYECGNGRKCTLIGLFWVIFCFDKFIIGF